MDRHLNSYLSYNYANELIENNLTRAFIVTLMGLSEETRNALLSSLSIVFSSYDFSCAKFALQSNIEINPREPKNKYIVTLSTDTFYSLEDKFKSIKKDVIKSTLSSKVSPAGSPEILKDLCRGSIPDAWIYDEAGNYCFLIECKKQWDYIYYPQIIRHAYEYFGLDDIDEIEKCTVRLTWYDLLDAFLEIIENNRFSNRQEEFMIENFIQYLGFFGYSKFKGFNFTNLLAHPRIKFVIDEYMKLFIFKGLKKPPKFRLSLLVIDSVFDKELFNFGKLAERLNVRLCHKGGD